MSGLPRSGTSMMMKMLEAGGVPLLTDGLRVADPDNPEGYYELERVKKLPTGDHEWLAEAPGQTRVGRFGWKNQQASLLSFAGDAYLNEMGITNRLQPNEVTTVCQPSNVAQPNDQSNDIDKFAAFIRATIAS